MKNSKQNIFLLISVIVTVLLIIFIWGSFPEESEPDMIDNLEETEEEGPDTYFSMAEDEYEPEFDLEQETEEDEEEEYHFKRDGESVEMEGRDFNEADEFILPESNSRYLTYDDLNGLDKSALRLARNEIYARHGRLYETEDLNAYFNSKSWYFGYISGEDFDDSVFNEYEKANLELIIAAEENRGLSNVSWLGTYIAEDEQEITVWSEDDTEVMLTFTGYSEEGWYTDTQVLSYENEEKTQVRYEEYAGGVFIQERVYTLMETGIQVETLPGGGWADGFYLRQ